MCIMDGGMRMKRLKRLLCAFVAVALVLLPPCALAEGDVLTVEEVSDSIFRIATVDGNGSVITLGTGFAVGDAAPVSYVATSNHVIENHKDNVMVWMNRDHFVKCTVVISLAQVDIAVLKLEKPINKPPLPLGDSSLVQQGNQVYTFGFPDYDITDVTTSYPGDVTATMGTISKKTKLNDIEYYQIDATVNSGNSGGPLFHEASGSVIGIITVKSTVSDDINGAVYIERLIEALKLESIPYLTAGEPQDEPQATQSAAPAQTIIQEAEEASNMLLIIGIILAALALVLLGIALYLRVRDRSAQGFDRRDRLSLQDEELFGSPSREPLAAFPPSAAQPVRRMGAPARAQEPAQIPREPAQIPRESAQIPRESAQIPREPAQTPREPLQIRREPAVQGETQRQQLRPIPLRPREARQEESEGATKRVDMPEKTVVLEKAKQRPVVRALGGFFAGGVVPVGAKLTIGRDTSSCQLVYPMEMTKISRKHVSVTFDYASKRFTLVDTSTNGTFLQGGERLRKNEPMALEIGAQFSLSGEEEMFRLDLEEA